MENELDTEGVEFCEFRFVEVSSKMFGIIHSQQHREQ